MPSRTSAARSTSTVVYFGSSESRICTTRAEKPHCGTARSPFMNSTTRSEAISEESLERVASDRLMGTPSTVFCGRRPSGRRPDGAPGVIL